MASVSAATVWEALRLDLVGDGGSPETFAPVDSAYVATLIAAAEERLVRWIGVDLDTFDELPAELGQAITVDVATHYFSRLNPELPDSYFDLIAGHRKWGFGAADDTDDS